MTAAIEALRAALAAGPTPTPWNAAYIAAACKAAPELLAEVDRQREVIRRVNAYADHLGMSLRDIKAERDALRAAIQQALPFTLLIGQEMLQRALKDTTA